MNKFAVFFLAVFAAGSLAGPALFAAEPSPPKVWLTPLNVPAQEFQQATLREVLEKLRSSIIRADPEHRNPNFVLAVPPAVAERRITLKRGAGDAAEMVRAAMALGGCEVQLERHGTVIREKGAPPLPPVRVAKGREQLRTMLERIVIPRAEFREATLRETIEFLVQRSKSADPEGAGMSMVLKLEGEGAPAPGPAPDAQARISLSVTDVPLLELCRYAAGQAGFEVFLEPFSILIAPPSAPAKPTPKTKAVKKK